MSQPFYPCDYTTVKEWSRWICAKELVDYLHERYGEDRVMEMLNVHGDAIVRRWFRWRIELAHGSIDVFNVDDFLMQIFGNEVMLNDLPDRCFSFWTHRKQKIKTYSTPQMRKACVKRVLNGESQKEVAREIGFSPDSVRKWVREHKVEPKRVAA
jgi:hypothetical protein